MRSCAVDPFARTDTFGYRNGSHDAASHCDVDTRSLADAVEVIGSVPAERMHDVNGAARVEAAR